MWQQYGWLFFLQDLSFETLSINLLFSKAVMIMLLALLWITGMLNKTKTTPFKVSLQELSFECFLTASYKHSSSLHSIECVYNKSRELQRTSNWGLFIFERTHKILVKIYNRGSNITKSTVTIVQVLPRSTWVLLLERSGSSFRFNLSSPTFLIFDFGNG